MTYVLKEALLLLCCKWILETPTGNQRNELEGSCSNHNQWTSVGGTQIARSCLILDKSFQSKGHRVL